MMGLKKVKKSGKDVKEIKDKDEKRLTELEEEMALLEKACEGGDDVPKHIRDQMIFTGKCIVIFKRSDYAEQAIKKFFIKNYQNCCLNCCISCFLCPCFCCCYPKYVDKTGSKHALFCERADEPSDIYYENLHIRYCASMRKNCCSNLVIGIVMGIGMGLIIAMKSGAKVGGGNEVLASYLPAIIISVSNKVIVKTILIMTESARPNSFTDLYRGQMFYFTMALFINQAIIPLMICLVIDKTFFESFYA
jgi:hypothetical protein